MSPSAYSAPTTLATVDGWPINLATLDETVDAIVGAAQNGESFSVVTLNVDHLVKLRRSASFRRAYQAAKLVTADGAPVAWLARRRDPSVTRTTGADLVIPLARAAAQQELPVYLFGTSNAVLAKTGRRLSQITDGALNICGTESPPQGFDPESSAADAALDRIAAAGAKLCFLALGAPKQEILAARAVERDIPVGFISIGAALDFIAGAQVRAPKVLQNSGLEWSWRLMTNPWRLAPRYAACALVLADVVVRDLSGLGQRHWSGSKPA